MENGLKELFWFVAIVVGLGIIWLVTGGAKQTAQSIVEPTVITGSGQSVSEANDSGSLLGNPSGNDSGDQGNGTVYVSGLTSYQGGGNGNGSGSSGSTGTGSTGTSESNTPSYDAATYAWITDKSPYFKEVTLGTGNVGGTDPTQEYITLNAWSGNSAPIDITGWRVLSLETGSTATIGNGVFLPYLGGTSIAQMIALAPGDSANIITGSSPLGFSFQANECSGYFTQFNDFTPGLNYSCPSIDQDLPLPPNALDDQCLDYLESYPTCSTPTQALPPGLSGSCQNFVTTNASYAQCIIGHKSDQNFYSHEWWIYLSRSQTLWKASRETIELLDANGAVVDVLQY